MSSIVFDYMYIYLTDIVIYNARQRVGEVMYRGKHLLFPLKTVPDKPSYKENCCVRAIPAGGQL